MRLSEISNWQAAFGQRFQHRSARGIRKRTEDGVETTMLVLNHKLMLNHVVQY
jgi:hypothetical protein